MDAAEALARGDRARAEALCRAGLGLGGEGEGGEGGGPAGHGAAKAAEAAALGTVLAQALHDEAGGRGGGDPWGALGAAYSSQSFAAVPARAAVVAAALALEAAARGKTATGTEGQTAGASEAAAAAVGERLEAFLAARLPSAASAATPSSSPGAEEEEGAHLAAAARLLVRDAWCEGAGRPARAAAWLRRLRPRLVALAPSLPAELSALVDAFTAAEQAAQRPKPAEAEPAAGPASAWPRGEIEAEGEREGAAAATAATEPRSPKELPKEPPRSPWEEWLPARLATLWGDLERPTYLAGAAAAATVACALYSERHAFRRLGRRARGTLAQWAGDLLGFAATPGPTLHVPR